VSEVRRRKTEVRDDGRQKDLISEFGMGIAECRMKKKEAGKLTS
jgi:hypothetical protein